MASRSLEVNEASCVKLYEVRVFVVDWRVDWY